MALLYSPLLDPDLQARIVNARDPDGRFVVPAAQFLALEIANPWARTVRRVHAALTQRLRSYREPLLPSSQRVFLMAALHDRDPKSNYFPTLEAERLALKFVESGRPVPEARWRMPWSGENARVVAASDGRVIGIFRESKLVEKLQSIVNEVQSPPGAAGRVVIAGVGNRERSRREVGGSDYLPDWTLALELDGSNPYERQASRQTAIYVCTSLVGIVGIGLFVAFVARAMCRAMRLAELKKDLLSTVSHELKTPVASMRLLVDTLLEERVHETEKVREYLELLSSENSRLSRLVDNFLTFSRLERQQHRFDFSDVDVADVVEESLRAYRDPLERDHCRFEVSVVDESVE